MRSLRSVRGSPAMRRCWLRSCWNSRTYGLLRRPIWSTPNDRALAEAAIRDELSLTLVEPVALVYNRLSQARIVRDRLPKTWRAFRAGKVDAYRVSLIGAAAHKLSDDDLSFIELDYTLADFAATHTGSQLRAKLNRFIASIEPDHAAARARAEHARRGVWVTARRRRHVRP